MSKRILLIMAGETTQKKTRLKGTRPTGRMSKMTNRMKSARIGGTTETGDLLGIRGLTKGIIGPESVAIGTQDGTTASRFTFLTSTSRWSREGNSSKIRTGDSTAMS